MLIPHDKEHSQSLLAQMDALGITVSQPPNKKNQQQYFQLMHLRDTAVDEAFPGAVLPYLVQKRIRFYIAARTGQEWRHLVPALYAAVGRTLTTFTGQPFPPDVQDDLIIALLQREGFYAATQFLIYDTKIADDVLTRLDRLQSSLKQAAQMTHEAPRSTAQLFYEFAMALAVRQREGAQLTIDHLGSTMRIDALNRYFLQVKLHITFEEWVELRAQPFFAQLCQVRRPQQVTTALCTALYKTIIQPFQQQGDVAGAKATFLRELLPLSGNLFAVCPQMPTASVGICFLLATVTSTQLDSDRIANLRRATSDWDIADIAFFERIIAASTLPVPASTIANPSLQDIYERELAAAEDMALAATFKRALSVLTAALEIATSPVYQIALNYVHRLQPEDMALLLSDQRAQRKWEELTSHVIGDRLPRNWLEFFRMLPTLTHHQVTRLLRDTATQWQFDTNDVDSIAITQLVEVIDMVPPEQTETLFLALPVLVQWIQSDSDWPNPALQAIYLRIFEYLLLSSDRSSATAQAIALLFSACLRLGTTAENYHDLLSVLGAALPSWKSINTIDWLIDLAECTVLYSCPNAEERLSFWHNIVNMLGMFASRMTHSQRIVITELATMLDSTERISFLKVSDEQALNTKLVITEKLSIGIYTLDERVAQLTKKCLAELYPTFVIKTNSDMVSTRQLSQLAREADILVVCWRAAKHAATIAIENERPSGLPTLYALGKGTSSIVREVEQKIKTIYS